MSLLRAPGMRRALLAALSLLLSGGCVDAAGTAIHEVELHEGWEFRRVPGDGEPAAAPAEPGARGTPVAEQPGAARPADSVLAAWHPATVPGTVHTDLLAAGLIPDPFFGTNELRLQWIEEEDWAYRTTFEVDATLLEHRNVELVFGGLDTFAEVRLNGRTILAADNMFRAWTVPAREHLREGPNELEVRFRSPVDAVMPALEALPYELPMGNDRGDPPTRSLARKAAYHYGWDWGPRFVTSGVWKPVRLRAWSGVRIADVHWTTTSLGPDEARLRGVVEVLADEAADVEVEVASPGDRFPAVTRSVSVEEGVGRVEVEVAIAAPRLWWPNGLGEAHLYELITRVRSGGRFDERLDRIGLRTVEVVSEPDSIGRSFHLRVNGRPVFMKGANWVPPDLFLPRVPDARYEALFAAMDEAHMNMVRVWGGGVYPDERFYDLADERGILVWQDFMFANALYPGDPAFLENVEAEAVQQVRRLRNHPSLALWCGNNEIREGLENWGWPDAHGWTEAGEAAIRDAYEALFEGLLPAVVADHDPGRFYWASSPLHGWGRQESLTHGDAHYWGVWWGREPFEVLTEKLPRFMSEFGFQGYPSMATVAAFTPPDERRLGSPSLESHQKHPTGLETIREYMARWYPVSDDLETFVYLSQQLQAEGMRMALEAQRRAMPRTMGTLYWQLGDAWPGASWSSVDFFGRRKALHHAVRRAFAPVLVSPVVEGDSVEAWVVNDRPEAVEGTLVLRLLDFRGDERFRAEGRVRVGPGESRRAVALARSLVLAGADPAAAVLEAELTLDDATRASNLLWFRHPRELRLATPDLDVDVSRAGDEYRIRLRSDVVARSVHLSAGGADGAFSDNDFDLLPDRAAVVRFRPEGDPPSGWDLRQGLVIRTLADVPGM